MKPYFPSPLVRNKTSASIFSHVSDASKQIHNTHSAIEQQTESKRIAFKNLINKGNGPGMSDTLLWIAQ